MSPVLARTTLPPLILASPLAARPHAYNSTDHKRCDTSVMLALLLRSQSSTVEVNIQNPL
jgi:hypothetical protein